MLPSNKPRIPPFAPLLCLKNPYAPLPICIALQTCMHAPLSLSIWWMGPSPLPICSLVSICRRRRRRARANGLAAAFGCVPTHIIITHHGITAVLYIYIYIYPNFFFPPVTSFLTHPTPSSEHNPAQPWSLLSSPLSRSGRILPPRHQQHAIITPAALLLQNQPTRIAPPPSLARYCAVAVPFSTLYIHPPALSSYVPHPCMSSVRIFPSLSLSTLFVVHMTINNLEPPIKHAPLLCVSLSFYPARFFFFFLLQPAAAAGWRLISRLSNAPCFLCACAVSLLVPWTRHARARSTQLPTTSLQTHTSRGRE